MLSRLEFTGRLSTTPQMIQRLSRTLGEVLCSRVCSQASGVAPITSLEFKLTEDEYELPFYSPMDEQSPLEQLQCTLTTVIRKHRCAKLSFHTQAMNAAEPHTTMSGVCLTATIEYEPSTSTDIPMVE